MAEPLVLNSGYGETEAAISPDGRRAVTLTSSLSDQAAQLWDLAGPGLNPIPLPMPKDRTRIFGPDRDFSTLYGVSENGAVRRWRTSEPSVLPRQVADLARPVTGGSFSPDCTLLATKNAESSTLWRLSGPNPKPMPLAGHKAEVLGQRFSPDGAFLVTWAADDTAILWELSEPGPVSIPLDLPNLRITQVAFSRDSKSLLVASDSKSARVWRTERPGEKPILLDLERLKLTIYGFKVELSPDGKTLAIVGGRERDLRNVRLLRVDRPDDEPLVLDSLIDTNDLRFSPDGNMLATIDAVNRIHSLRLSEPKAGAVLLGSHAGQARLLHFSDDGRRLLTLGRDDRRLIVWTILEEDLARKAHETAGRELTDGERSRFNVPRSLD
jgi:WD40 repeat protein